MDTQPLQGQCAQVTGADSGIGAAIAVALGAAGAKVAVNYRRSRAGAQAVADRIEQAGAQALCLQAEVSHKAEVGAMFRSAINAFGMIDILVNNAGVQHDGALHALSLDDWRKVIDVNLTGQFLCAREAVRKFMRCGPVPQRSRATGKIICISSVHEAIPWAGHADYAASKGGVAMLMSSMAQELAPQRIRVNSIAPGAIKTDINEAAWQTPPARDALLTVDGGMMLYPAFRSGG